MPYPRIDGFEQWRQRENRMKNLIGTTLGFYLGSLLVARDLMISIFLTVLYVLGLVIGYYTRKSEEE